ncbi:DUF742 domain-containing protein [Micromonosporaceae bacterium Da 78-11]
MTHRGEWAPDPRMIPYAERTAPAATPPAPGPPPPEPGEDLVVRPFMLTGGRTRPLQDGLRIETLMLAPPAALSAPLRFESRRIVELCQAPMSIADLAAALRVPLGVVRVIAADLVTGGYLRVTEQLGEFPIAMIERIRDRVRALQ